MERHSRRAGAHTIPPARGQRWTRGIRPIMNIITVIFLRLSKIAYTKFSAVPSKTHLCVACIIRAMPETEIPPALRGDHYLGGMAVEALAQSWEDSIKIFSEIKNAIGTDVYISLMCQYVPMFNAKNYKEINRRLTPLEYKKVVREITNRLGFNKGFVQEPSSADACYTPDFSPDKFFEL